MTYSPNPLLSGNIQGPTKIWLVGGIFLGAGLLMALLPTIITPSPNEQTQIAQGKIVELIYDDDGSAAEVYQFTTASGQNILKRNNVWSKPPAYQINDQIEIYYDSTQPEQNSWIKDDRGTLMINGVLYGLGAYFSLFGLLIILMQLRGIPIQQIETICGAIGALSFGIPSTLALPVLYWLYQSRPNFLYAQDSIFPQESYLIGAIFSLLGVIVTVATILMLRATKDSGSNSIHFSAKL